MSLSSNLSIACPSVQFSIPSPISNNSETVSTAFISASALRSTLLGDSPSSRFALDGLSQVARNSLVWNEISIGIELELSTNCCTATRDLNCQGQDGAEVRSVAIYHLSNCCKK